MIQKGNYLKQFRYQVVNAEPRRRAFLSVMFLTGFHHWKLKIESYKLKIEIFTIGMFLTGAISFYLAIDLLTEPSLYQNTVYNEGL